MPTEGTVTRVVDGDTIDVNRVRIRLIGIDTPEIKNKKYNKIGYCYGKQATDFLRDLLLNQKVTLLGDPQSDKKDKYGRFLAYVYLGNRDINAEIIEKGYGFTYRKSRHAKEQKYLELENQARENNVGAWKHCDVDCRKGYCKTKPEK